MTQYECSHCENWEQVQIMELKGTTEDFILLQCPRCGDIVKVGKSGPNYPEDFVKIFGVNESKEEDSV
jgi:uncharacterized Zn finger protein